jgi:hypothetical protein
MAYPQSADGIAKKGRTDAAVRANSGPAVATTTGGKGSKSSKGGKTDEDMLKLGRNMAKLANQKRG